MDDDGVCRSHDNVPPREAEAKATCIGLSNSGKVDRATQKKSWLEALGGLLWFKTLLQSYGL
jgi:hypothetical protein